MKSGRSSALKQEESGLPPDAHCVGIGAGGTVPVLTGMEVDVPTSHVYVALPSDPTVVPTPAPQPPLQLSRHAKSEYVLK